LKSDGAQKLKVAHNKFQAYNKMGITKYSMPGNRKRMQRKFRKLVSYNFKKHKRSQQHSIDIPSLLEEKLYNLNSSILHLKLYIKKMMYEYVGDTRAEIAVFYAMAVNLHKECNHDYCMVMSNIRSVIDVDIKKYEEDYEGVLDLCGVTTDEVYENMFGENDDGYETPPREYEYQPETSIENMLEELAIH
jgi:hypothetical protein